MFITPINVSYDENITTYTISIIFADRINDDKFNLVDVQSDMSIQSKRFISWIKRGMNQNPNLYDNMEINLPVTGIPFMERFNDYVGGIAIDAEVVVFEDINACDYYIPPTPSVTPTSTITPTPTTTSTVTPTKTPTPTPTPSSSPPPPPTPTPAACKTYKVTYGPQKVGGTEPSFTYTDCATGLGTTIFVGRFNVGAVYNVCVKRVNNNYSISTGVCNCDANFTFEQLGNC
jgi:hypothetical protein